MEHSQQPLRPAAEALIRGGASYPGLSGAVSFTPTAAGVLVMADLEGLPTAAGRGFLAVLTDRFSLPEVVGHTVILHGHLDDFTTQPSGSAGEKIACGVIRRLA